MFSPLLIIGPTSSGKTNLSLFLATKIPDFITTKGVDILVVDSKQAYKEQDIVTGKDIPENYKKQETSEKFIQTHYKDEKKDIRLFGIDLINPNEDWSVAQFIAYAQWVKQQSEKDGRFLIIVGGTPLYTLSLFNIPQTSVVTPDVALREELSLASIDDLQQRLKKLSPKRLLRMNESDKRNPRRLTRAIEIELAKKLQGGWLPAHQVQAPLSLSVFSKEKVCWIGLSVEKEILEQRIRTRVEERVLTGAIEEYKKLQDAYYDWKPEAKLAIGYFDIENFVLGKTTKEELISLWTTHEVQYAKRQMTWWKREKQIEWFVGTDSDLKNQVLVFIKNWYNEK